MTEAAGHSTIARMTPLPLLSTLLTPLFLGSSGDFDAPEVTLGVDVLLSGEGGHLAQLEGKRVGLVTNPSGVDGDLVQTIDRLWLHDGVDLVQLWGPEHGLRGDVPAGEQVSDGRDARTGVAVESLYGSRRRPSPESLARVDVVLFDIQDLGSRTYTYVSTLGEVMLACQEAGKPLVVLDRPNPLGGVRFEGPVIPQELRSFVGWGPMPVTHGMTLGEAARFFAAELPIELDLHVVPMDGWRREMVWDDTGLTWVQTSPHVPHALHAYLYVCTGMVGGVTANVNEGVGYTLPFETIAAPFADASRLAAALEGEELPGLRFTPVSYTPYYGRHAGTALNGVRLIVEDPHAMEPLHTALTILCVLERLYPGEVEYRDDFAQNWGDARVLTLLRAGRKPVQIEHTWTSALTSFAAARERALIYR